MYEDLWRSSAGREETPALRCGDCVLTVREVLEKIREAEAGFRALGVEAGSVVTLFAVNTPEAILAFYALDRIGAVSNWVDIKLSPAEVEEYLTSAQSQVVLAMERIVPKILKNRGAAPMRHLIVLPVTGYLTEALARTMPPLSIETVPGVTCWTWDQVLRAPADVPPDTKRWEEPAAITYTGGTTGPAKGVMLSRRAFRASLEQYRKAETEYGTGSSLTLLPMFAAFGLCQCVHVPLCQGMTVITEPLFPPDGLGQLLVRFRPEQVCGTTSYWRYLLEDPSLSGQDLSFLKVPRCGGDALSAVLERRIVKQLRDHGCTASMVKEYGMTEVCGIVCLSYGGGDVFGDAGRPLPGCRIAAVDPDTGKALPAGQTGELLIHSDTVMNGYYGQPQADGEVLKPGPDGLLWAWTKDLGYITEDGHVMVTGRIKRMISRHGYKIFPSVVEACLMDQDIVTDCVVTGWETPKGETALAAHIVVRRGTDRAEAERALRELCQRRLNRFLRPALYRFYDALPLTERGKHNYRKLESLLYE